MFRAFLELVITIILALAARAILGSLMKGFNSATRGGFGQASAAQEPPPAQPRSAPKERVNVAGELHKDPVCGMYVAESTLYQRRSGRESFYYCSAECKDKHAMAAR